MAGLKLVIPIKFTDSSLPVLPPTPTVITSDSFNRPDGGVLGVTDAAFGGKPMPWVVVPQIGIVGNKMAGISQTTTRFPYVDVGKTNHRTEITLTGYLNGGVTVRAKDDVNYYAAHTTTDGALTVDKRVAGVVTTLGAVPGAVTLGDRIALKAAGNTLTAYVNGVEVLTVQDSSHPSNTGCGVRTSYNNALWRADDFLVTDI